MTLRDRIEAYIQSSGLTDSTELFLYVHNTAEAVIRKHHNSEVNDKFIFEDVRNGIILKVFSNIEKVYNARSVSNYIYTIARNYIRDLMRRRSVSDKRTREYNSNVIYTYNLNKSSNTIDIEDINYFSCTSTICNNNY